MSTSLGQILSTIQLYTTTEIDATFVPYSGATAGINLNAQSLINVSTLGVNTSVTVPTVYGSSAANGDLILNGTSSATKTTSYVSLQQGGGNVILGTDDGNAATTILLNSQNVTGGTSINAYASTGIIQSDVTSISRCFISYPSTAVASFTLSNLYHYEAKFNIKGAGSSITNQVGFLAGSSLNLASANYGFWGEIPATSSNWNCYMTGTAQNYFAGNVGVGLPIALAKLHSQSTTEQLRLGYDASNYYSTTVGSTGGVTYTAVGSGANFTFNKDAVINTLTIGLGSGQIATNTAIGWNVFNAITTGSYNTSTGYDSMSATTTGERNAAFGMTALTANTTGSYNAAFGKDALANNIGGNYNTGIGHGAGFNISTGVQNTILGWNTGAGITTGSYNTIIGANVTGLSATLANNIILADGAGTIRMQVDSSGNFSFTGGTVTTEALTSDQTWTITINGVTKKVLIKS